MKINEPNNKFYWIYKIGFFIILALPLLVFSFWFFPPDWGKTLIFRSVMAILLFLFLYQILSNASPRAIVEALKKNKILWALGGLFTVFLLATIFSVDPRFSLWGSPYRGGGFINFASYIIFAIFIFLIAKKEDWKKFWDFSIFIGVLVCTVGIIQYYGLFSNIFSASPTRPASTMGNPILLGIYLLLLIFIALSFLIKEQNKFLKVFYIFSLLLFSYTILITGSRAAYLGLVAGGVFFFLRYPTQNNFGAKIIKYVKIAVICLIVLTAGFVVYINTASQYPKFLENNKIFQGMRPRLSTELILSDPRFYAWSRIDYKILAEKPILGWGPENFAVGFDKYYDPSIPYLSRDWGSWWDRAHNVLIDVACQAGLFALVIYLALFIILFWELHKKKYKTESGDKQIIMHGVQATLIGYFVANFFSFDSFSTYLLFFLLVAYTLHLTSGDEEKNQEPLTQQKNTWHKPVIITIAFLALIIFLWQYNFVPLKINSQINQAEALSKSRNCAQAFSIMDRVLLQHSFLDSYARMQYVEFTIICNNFYPENNLTYIKNGMEVISQALKAQPLYTRYWLSMGTYKTNLAEAEEDENKKNVLLEEAEEYFIKALELGPKHQEILIGQAKMEMARGDYNKMKDYSMQCVSLDPSLSDCYWYLAISQIYLKDTESAKTNIEMAARRGYQVESEAKLKELANVYASIQDNQALADIFEKLTKINPENPQYHSTLAFFYKELRRYKEARAEALKTLELSPESKDNVNAFLKTLPY